MSEPLRVETSVEAAKRAQLEERAAAEQAVPGLRITDEGAILRPRKVLVFPVESRVERAAHSAVAALDDLESAVQCAETIGELDVLTTLAAELQEKLWQCERAARTYREHFSERRRT
jgi:hypothetical protein